MQSLKKTGEPRFGILLGGAINALLESPGPSALSGTIFKVPWLAFQSLNLSSYDLRSWFWGCLQTSQEFWHQSADTCW